MTSSLVGLHAQLACIWEVTARKAGNVHRFRDFEDVTYLDFVTSAAALGRALEQAPHRPLGQTIHDAVRQTRQVAPSNTNLGMVLLLAPLARASTGGPLRERVEEVLAATDVADAAEAYAAIRLASPGGLGKAPEQDVSAPPTLPLRAAMALAAERDLVARQYANGFVEVLDEVVPALEDGMARTRSLEGGILAAQLRTMARHPDSLIARKRGAREAEEAGELALRVLEAGWPETERGRAALGELDGWLRADGHARNPGTTADLIAAGLYAMLREGKLTLPLNVPWALPTMTV